MTGSLPNIPGHTHIKNLSVGKSLSLVVLFLASAFVTVNNCFVLLCSLSSAHNKLSGTIPFSLQTADFNELDLSYNRLTGEYNHGDHGHEDHGHHEEDDTDGEEEEEHDHALKSAMMNLQVNRLSGPLSETAYSLLRILDGNLFGCDFIPEEDENSDTYACGK